MLMSSVSERIVDVLLIGSDASVTKRDAKLNDLQDLILEIKDLALRKGLEFDPRRGWRGIIMEIVKQKYEAFLTACREADYLMNGMPLENLFIRVVGNGYAIWNYFTKDFIFMCNVYTLAESVSWDAVRLIPCFVLPDVADHAQRIQTFRDDIHIKFNDLTQLVRTVECKDPWFIFLSFLTHHIDARYRS